MAWLGPSIKKVRKNWIDFKAGFLPNLWLSGKCFCTFEQVMMILVRVVKKLLDIKKYFKANGEKTFCITYLTAYLVI